MNAIKKQKYIVWVDSIPNHFNNLLDAEIEKINWINKGYKNVVIEKIKQPTKL